MESSPLRANTQIMLKQNPQPKLSWTPKHNLHLLPYHKIQRNFFTGKNLKKIILIQRKYKERKENWQGMKMISEFFEMPHVFFLEDTKI
jgi:hypothetical protein